MRVWVPSMGVAVVVVEERIRVARVRAESVDTMMLRRD